FNRFPRRPTPSRTARRVEDARPSGPSPWLVPQSVRQLRKARLTRFVVLALLALCEIELERAGVALGAGALGALQQAGGHAQRHPHVGALRTRLGGAAHEVGDHAAQQLVLAAHLVRAPAQARALAAVQPRDGLPDALAVAHVLGVV